MAQKMFRAVILGAPASGKGTISARIVTNFNLEHISSGDKLRHQIQNQTAIGKEVSKFISAGKLVSDEIMVKFIMSEISSVKGPWLLDGFPRTRSQCEALWQREQLDMAINLIVPFEIIIERVKNRWIHLPSGRVYNLGFSDPKIPGKDDITGEDLVQRVDDKPEVVQKRLKEYETMTRPVIEFFKEKRICHDFTGSATNVIWPKVLDTLSSYIPLNIKGRQNG